MIASLAEIVVLWICVEKRFLEQRDAMREDHVAHHDQATDVVVLLLADERLTFVARGILRLVEGATGAQRPKAASWNVP